MDHMRLRLHAEMDKQVVKNTSLKTSLTFDETMVVNGVDKSVQLCENCFVHLHAKVCKKTFANWKRSTKIRVRHDPVRFNLSTSTKKIRNRCHKIAL